MISTTVSHPEEILLEIRHAYRLLFQYQQRIKDLMKFISVRYRMPYRGGWPRFSQVSPRLGKGILDNWGWDWLNMYCYEFYFGYVAHGEKKITLSVVLVNDTGFYENEEAFQLDLTSFADVAKAKSHLLFVLGDGVWDMNIVLTKERLSATRDARQKVTIGDEVVYTHSFPLSMFFTETNAVIALQLFESHTHADIGFDLLNYLPVDQGF